MSRMALLHRAELRPSKLDLLAGWLPGRPWWREPAGGDLVRVTSFRFDDPDGEVGIETLLVRAGDGPAYQVPLTYRGAALGGADDWLIGTMQHSVLGPRWVYDGCGDPVYAAALARAILTGAGQAEELIEVDGRLERRAPGITVTGSGVADADVPAVGAVRHVAQDDPTIIETDGVQLTVVRRLDAGNLLPGAVLTATWDDQPTPVPLAYASPR
jgi:hypothetical protein